MSKHKQIIKFRWWREGEGPEAGDNDMNTEI